MHGQGHRRDGGGPIAVRATGRTVLRSRWWLAALSLLALLALGYVLLLRPSDEGEAGVTVFAAASLREVTDALEAAWDEAHPAIPLTIVTEASNMLAAQIAQGAQADVFLSADDVRPAELAQGGHTAASPFPLVRNEVVLVAGLETPVTTAAMLADPGTRIVVGGPATPIGRYTEEAIDALAAASSDAGAFRAAVEANIASREDNVRAALAKVELGEGDVAFVYRTDALGSEAVRRLELPASARVAADYAAVLVSDRSVAREFIDWLREPAAGRVLADAGFEVGS